MHCAVYRSAKKLDTYLYIEQKDDFSRVPERLLSMLGNLQWVMDIDLSQRDRLAHADPVLVKQKLAGEGFFLQLPPKHYQPV